MGYKEESTMIENVKQLSPRRNTTEATNISGLVDEQLAHFGMTHSHLMVSVWDEPCLTFTTHKMT